ncbi:MAG TPA: hypothetical protein VEC16_02720 [Alphaproteobacteria bacterium]|nr:hypothetical protein [Alphaproteobacteria bacterium]
MKKQGVELSMNVIIIAAIGLLVLVILAVLVINASGRTQGSLQACNVKGGVCGQTCGSNGVISDAKCDAGLQCCRVFVADGGQ